MSKSAQLVANEHDAYHFPWKCSTCNVGIATSEYVWNSCYHGPIRWCPVCGSKFSNPQEGEAAHMRNEPNPFRS